MMQFTDHVKFKNLEEQSVDISVLHRRRNKIITGGIVEVMYGAEMRGKAIQRQHHAGIHHISYTDAKPRHY